jgi:hypothetical protein
MKYFKYTISLDQGKQTPEGKWAVTNNQTEIFLEELTDSQHETLSALFASLLKGNKAKIDKTVEAIR